MINYEECGYCGGTQCLLAQATARPLASLTPPCLPPFIVIRLAKQ